MISDPGKYNFNFPLKVFSSRFIKNLKEPGEITPLLEKRNVFYYVFDQEKKDLLINRIISLNTAVEFLIKIIEKQIDNKIISLFAYGSYLYGFPGYRPDDIDIGVIVENTAFKYIINKILIPQNLSNKLIGHPRKLNLFIYGEDNISKGVPIEDTVVAGIIHKETTRRELSVAYYRDVVLWGKDFCCFPENKKNILVHLGIMINGCYERIYGLSIKKENEKTRFRKIGSRLGEVNAFLKFLDPLFDCNIDYFLSLPLKATDGMLTHKKMKDLCDSTAINYERVRKKLEA